MNPLLDAELSTVPTATVNVPQFRDGVLFTGREFFTFLNRKCHWFDRLWVITYSSSKHLCLDVPIERLIQTRGDYPAEEVRIATNIHTKLYLLRQRRTTRVAFIGSHNLVAPNVFEEIMILVQDDTTCKTLTKYFTTIWNQLKS